MDSQNSNSSNNSNNNKTNNTNTNNETNNNSNDTNTNIESVILDIWNINEKIENRVGGIRMKIEENKEKTAGMRVKG